MYRILIYYTISCLLLVWLAFLKKEKYLQPLQKPSMIYQWIEPILESNFDKKSKGQLLLKLVLGIGPSLHSTVKKPFVDLYLYSLITFNYLHLWLLYKVLRIHKVKYLKYLASISVFLISLNPLFIKSILNENLITRFKRFHTFLLVQLILAILSVKFKFEFTFIFGFIFSGLFLMTRSLSRTEQIWHLAIIQTLIALALSQSISIVGIIFSVIIIRLFVKLYNFIFVFMLICFIGNFHWTNFLINSGFTIIKYISSFSNGFKIDFTLLLLLVLILLKYCKKMWPYAFLLLINCSFALCPIIHYSK